jgi:hypothetical protein
MDDASPEASRGHERIVEMEWVAIARKRRERLDVSVSEGVRAFGPRADSRRLPDQ